jgi:hypothetical protein
VVWASRGAFGCGLMSASVMGEPDLTLAAIVARLASEQSVATSVGNILPAEAEARYYAMLEQLPMAA